MVVLIGNSIVCEKPTSIKNFYDSYPSLAERAKAITREKVKDVGPKSVLFVGQGEYAIIPSSDMTVEVIGSDEATTCHIVILNNPGSKTVSTAHLDGRRHEKSSLNKIIAEMMCLDSDLSEIDVYVLGGYSESVTSQSSTEEFHFSPSNCSHEISINLLHYFIDHPMKFQIKLWCTCHMNTVQIGSHTAPLFLGLAFDRLSNTVFPAHFPAQVPCASLRAAEKWVCESTWLRNIYDDKECVVFVEPFYDWPKDRFAFCSKLPDESLLANFSTSPLVEPKSFCTGLRSTFEMLGSNETLFNNKQTRKFKLNDYGVWEEVNRGS